MKRNIIIFALIIVICLSAFSFFYQGPFTGYYVQTLPQLSLEGFSEASVSVDQQTIYVTTKCYILPMLTTEDQASSIKSGMDNSRYFRPNTHDLMQDELEMFEIKVLMVKIESFHEGAYYAKLVLQQGNKILNLDSRPSDAISIAVRFGSPIYIKDDLMKQFGKNVC